MATQNLTNRFIGLRNAYNKRNRIDIDNLSSYFKSLVDKGTEKARSRFEKSSVANRHKQSGKSHKREKKSLLNGNDSSDEELGKINHLQNSDDDDDDEDDGIQFTLLTETHEAMNKRQKNEINGIKNDKNNENSNNTFNITAIAGDITRLPIDLQNRLKHMPAWMQCVNDVDSNIRQIRIQLGELRKCQNERLKVQFVDHNNKYNSMDATIESLTQTLTALFRDTQIKVKKIATIQDNNDININMATNENEMNFISKEEQQMRLSGMRSRAKILQTLSQDFRHMQRHFLEKSREREQRLNRFIDIGQSTQHLSLDLEKIENGLTQEQLLELDNMYKESDQRTKEIINISKSVNELATIFRDLGVLVVEAGTILDRIDYNVEQTLTYIESSTKHIKKAETYQKKQQTSSVILVLLALIVVALVILVIKHLF